MMVHALVLALAAGPVLLNGNPNITGTIANVGDTMTVNVAEPNAPSNVYFMAGGNFACAGNLSISAGEGPGAPEYAMLVTATRQFVFTRLGDPTGCSVTITSSDGGAPATITF